jgi:transcriptional regulator
MGMYQPRLFREEDRARLHDLIDRNPFATLIVVAPGSALEIAHVPVLLERDGAGTGKERLLLHVAAANPIWKAALAAGQVVVVFAGPHGYVSPTWYEHPSEQVPTWNYAVVHAHGIPKKLERDELVRVLDELVSAYEGRAPEAWRASPAIRDELAREIVGLSIDVTKLEGKFKLSQNRSEVDQARVVDGLRARATPEDIALADLMTPRS